MIHIEGMGWLGAAVAFRLHQAGIDFTWNDTDAEHVAWKACTGSVYPGGDSDTNTNLARWGDYHRQGLFPDQTVVPVAYGYAHKSPPHGGTYTPVADLGWLRVASAPAYVVDAAGIVLAARGRFANRRVSAAPDARPVVVAHGHTNRRGSWIWGWSAPVRLDLPDDLTAAAAGRPVILYGRAHRFAVTYAYPMPGRPGWHLAGSSMMNQRTPRRLDVAAHLASWRKHFAHLYPPVQVLQVEEPVQGWRPKARLGDGGGLKLPAPGRLILPPMGHSGVRLAPGLIDAAAAWAAGVQARDGVTR